MEVERSSIMTHSGKYIIFFHVTYPMSELAEPWIQYMWMSLGWGKRRTVSDDQLKNTINRTTSIYT